MSNAVLNARNIGYVTTHTTLTVWYLCHTNHITIYRANSFALFLKSPRKWDSPPISKSEASEFKRLCEVHGYDPKT